MIKLTRIIKAFYWRILINSSCQIFASLAVILCGRHLSSSFDKSGISVKDYLKIFWKSNNRKLLCVKPKYLFIGISDPMFVLWRGTSDADLALLFKVSNFALKKICKSDYKYFAFIMFCGYLKRLGMLDQVHDFSEAVASSSTGKLRALALREQADIKNLYYRWYNEQKSIIEDGFYLVLYDNFVRKTDQATPYEASFYPVSYEAIHALYQSAICADPTLPWLYYEIGNQLKYEEEFDEALQCYDMAVSLGAGDLVICYAEQLRYFLTKNCSYYRIKIDNVKGIEEGRRFPRKVKLSSLSALMNVYPTIDMVWPEYVLGINYRAAYKHDIVTISKQLNYDAKGLGIFENLRKLSHPFSVIDNQYMLTDTTHFHFDNYRMFNTHLLDYDRDEASIFYRDKGKKCKEQHIYAPVILLGGRITRPEYYHTIFDALGSLALIEEYGFFPERDIVIGEKPNRWVADLLREMKLPNKIRFVDQTNDTSSRIIYHDVLQLSCTAKMTVPHPRTIDFLRRRLCPNSMPVKSGKYLHLSRKKTRSISDKRQRQFYSYLESKGFEIVDTGSMTVAEQKELLQDVEIVSAEGGAALSNLLFCPEGVKIIVIAPSMHVFEVWSVIAQQLNQKFWLCLEDVSASYPNPFFLWSSAVLDVDIPTYDLCLTEAIEA